MKETVTVLISDDAIAKRLKEMAEEISNDYSGESVTLVCILKGAVIFMADLARQLDLPVEFDFMDISSYGNNTVNSGKIKVNKDLDNSAEGKNIIIIEDIIDTGRTLTHLLSHIKAQNPKSLKLCALLDKPERRVVSDVSIDYTGFVVPNEFVVGYGLDYAQRYRNLPFIGIISFNGE